LIYSLSTIDNNAAKEETCQRVEQNKISHCYGQEIIENYTGKKKEKVSKIMGFLFPCYYRLYAYSRVRNLNLPLFNKLRFF
jgi:hypothetical protein